MPIDSRSEVVRSPFKELIDECLQSRWSCARVHRHLCSTYGPGYPHLLKPKELWTRYRIPSVKSIQRYQEAWLPTVQALPESLIAEKMGGLDVQVDTVQELARLVPVLRERAAKALDLEESMNGMLLPTTDKAVETFAGVWKQYVEHAFDLGLIKKVGVNVMSTDPFDVSPSGGSGDGGGVPLDENGELDFDAMPTEILKRIMSGESRVRFTRVERGPTPLRTRRRTRGGAEGGAGADAANAGEAGTD